ncbi:MAG: hypothetical protein KKC46_04350 [Proteobacteria bacterium]|nr:hypothetical protein [Pseudomonadota bacterium]
MKRYPKIIIFILLSLFICSCSSIQLNYDEKYQPLGTAVLTANDFLMVKYYKDRPEFVQEKEYKDLLKESYKPMYDRLLPHSVEIKNTANSFIVSVSDGKKLILTDWLCTEGRIDCWSYNGECNPETVNVECDR